MTSEIDLHSEGLQFGQPSVTENKVASVLVVSVTAWQMLFDCAHVTAGQELGDEGLSERLEDFSSVFLRLALGVSFLSAVGDRVGLWGAFGTPGVAWGDFSHFVAYTAKLNWFMPSATITAMAWVATCAEGLLGIALVLGVFTRVAAFLSGLLLLLFALVMTFALGLEAPLSFSVFSASAGAFLLATCSEIPWSVDSLRSQRGGECL